MSACVYRDISCLAHTFLSYREDPLEVDGTKLYIRLANIVLLGQIYNPAYKRPTFTELVYACGLLDRLHGSDVHVEAYGIHHVIFGYKRMSIVPVRDYMHGQLRSSKSPLLIRSTCN